MFTAGLDGNFTPPSPGYYVFGIGTTSQWIGIFGGSYYNISSSPNTTVPLSRAPAPEAFQANWGLLFAAVSQQPSVPPPPPAISTLAVQILSVPNSPVASIPGVVYGVLYSSSGFEALAYMNSSGYLNFNNLTPGTYTLEVYHYPNLGSTSPSTGATRRSLCKLATTAMHSLGTSRGSTIYNRWRVAAR